MPTTWAVQELRRLCAEAEFGTRSIAMQLIRSGIRVSRSSVQRILREKKPAKPPEPSEPPKEQEPVAPHSILRPAHIRRTYHLDFTTFDFLFVRFYVAAVIDGFSRRLIALKVFPDAPTTAAILRLLRRTFREYGACRFLVTDHGCQFRKRFKEAIENTFGVTFAKERVRAATMNGKVERIFRTLKAWQKLKLLFTSERSIQKKLDIFRRHYNGVRPMWTLGMRTPDETWAGTELPRVVLIPECDPVKPAVNVTRKNFLGDPLLPVLDIETAWRKRHAA
jgi:transposase InsO family protein